MDFKRSVTTERSTPNRNVSQKYGVGSDRTNILQLFSYDKTGPRGTQTAILKCGSRYFVIRFASSSKSRTGDRATPVRCAPAKTGFDGRDSVPRGMLSRNVYRKLRAGRRRRRIDNYCARNTVGLCEVAETRSIARIARSDFSFFFRSSTRRPYSIARPTSGAHPPHSAYPSLGARLRACRSSGHFRWPQNGPQADRFAVIGPRLSARTNAKQRRGPSATALRSARSARAFVKAVSLSFFFLSGSSPTTSHRATTTVVFAYRYQFRFTFFFLFFFRFAFFRPRTNAVRTRTADRYATHGARWCTRAHRELTIFGGPHSADGAKREGKTKNVT